MPETLILRQLQARVSFENRHGSRASAPHQACVPFQIANLQRWQAALRRAEHIARPTLFPVRFGHFKAIRRSFQNCELRRRLWRLVGAQQNAIRFMLTTTDAATELV